MTRQSLPDSLAPLAILRTARSNAAEYYAPLLNGPSEVLRMGAWTALLERNEVGYDQYPAVLELASRNPGIRRRAFRHFLKWWDYDEAGQALAALPPAEDHFETDLMQAELASDQGAVLEAQRALYLAKGDFELLSALVGMTERILGWSAALPVAVECVILAPHDANTVLQLLTLLRNARQTNLMESLAVLLDETTLHPAIALLARASIRLLQGNPRGCLTALGQLNAMRISRPDVAHRIRAQATELSAEALERLGEYRQAYAAYVELKKLDTGKAYDLGEFERTILGDAALDVPPLPDDPRRECFVMTGFPRSGTTLLENALAAHPLIETFEEIPSWSSMQLYLDLTLPKVTPDTDMVPIYLRTRERYYAEIDRLRRKSEAKVLIDKMPIRSAEAAFLAKLFPERRFIFSIRHPFDVVLSCFKQSFVRNVAMEHFRTFEGAVKLYDFTMRQWFSIHSMTDPKVHYLRYDDLVTKFEDSMRGVLDFLGLGWDDKVLGFATLAETRGARTPSYQKVRQGLGIGVQSSWRNYGFLFQSETARPLRKWVEHFGYELQ